MSGVRLTGGHWRGRVLDVPRVADVRPTKGLLREVLGNWLGNDCQGLWVVDVFAGSGALGFELLSRGASEAILIDNQEEVARCLARNIAKLEARATVLACDYRKALSQLSLEGPGVVVADPPYAWTSDDMIEFAQCVADVLPPEPVTMVVEHSARLEVAWPCGWVCHKVRRQGRSMLSWLQRV